MSGLVNPYLTYRSSALDVYIGFAEPPNDGLLNILSRTNAITWACRFAVPECAQNAQLQYSAWMNSPADVE